VRWIFVMLLLAGCWDNLELPQPDLASPPVNDLAVTPQDLSAHD
jgi:hypothetical protein